jgi:hypothetical protein
MRWILFISILLISFSSLAKPPSLNNKQKRTHPPRVTRTCCAFGTNLKIAGIPFAHMNTAIEFTQIGTHKYLGGKEEGNGILYTSKGGFIDLGHLREWADWTAFLYLHIKDSLVSINAFKSLGIEGGKRLLALSNTSELIENDRLLLAGRIAFELSHWHEILGINLAIKAILSELTFDKAMTQLLNKELMDLGVVPSIEETYEALDQVENIWWSNEFSVPNKKIMLKRSYLESSCVEPWLIPLGSDTIQVAELEAPTCTVDGIDFSQYFTLNIKANRKIPIRKALPDHRGKTISQLDFDLLIQYIRVDLTEIEVKAAFKSGNKKKRG